MRVMTGCHSGIFWCYRGSVCSRYVCSCRCLCHHILEVSKIEMCRFNSFLQSL